MPMFLTVKYDPEISWKNTFSTNQNQTINENTFSKSTKFVYNIRLLENKRRYVSNITAKYVHIYFLQMHKNTFALPFETNEASLLYN